jgi:hypothetical protein
MLPFITVVLAINQLILSAEFGTTGAFRERLEETHRYREEIEEHTNVSPSPVEPSAFLRTPIRKKREVSSGLRDASADVSPALRETIDGYVGSTMPKDDDAVDQLEGGTFGAFAGISTILDYNDPWQLREVRRIRERFEDELSEAMDDRFALYAMDMRGFGNSSYEQPVDSLADLAGDVHFFHGPGYPTWPENCVVGGRLFAGLGQGRPWTSPARSTSARPNSSRSSAPGGRRPR